MSTETNLQKALNDWNQAKSDRRAVIESLRTLTAAVNTAEQKVLEEVAGRLVGHITADDLSISTFWECTASPIGWCVYDYEKDDGEMCLFCGDPEERK